MTLSGFTHTAVDAVHALSTNPPIIGQSLHLGLITFPPSSTIPDPLRPGASLTTSIRARFTEALDSLIEIVKDDRSVLAAILCGSLSHDTVWAKSDIDLVLVTVDERKPREGGVSLYANGVNVHAFLVSRTQFRRIVEGSIRNSFVHSFLTKGRLLYTHDETITDLCERLHEIGERDTQLQLLRAATEALGPIYKAHKWLVTRADLEYTALWILYAATPLAQMEVIGRRLLADREVIPQAMTLNPAFFKTVYSDLLNGGGRTRAKVEAALEAVDAYVADRAPTVFAPIIEHLRDVGEARSCTEIEDYFARNVGVEGVTTACEYLADRGLIGKVSTPVKLTARSNVEVQELAFVWREPAPGESAPAFPDVATTSSVSRSRARSKGRRPASGNDVA